MIHPKKAYWGPIPVEFLTAIGAVEAHRVAAEDKSSSFRGRTKLLRRMARKAFVTSDTLTRKVCAYTERAHATCQKRNIIVHGHWLDLAPFGPHRNVRIATKPDGTGDFYSVALDQIELLAENINELLLEGLSLFFTPSSDDDPFLTQAELLALRAYHRDFPPPSHPLPIHRDPKRKGTPPHPEPFRA